MSEWRERLQDGLTHWARRDGPVVLAYVAATVVMTYPLAFRLGGRWLATRDVDTFAHLWNAWWFGQVLKTGQSPYFSSGLFYPTGLDLTFNSFSWLHAALSWLLKRAVSDISANNITILIAVFGTAYGGYLLARSMVRHRAAAWLGGAIYSFAPYHISHAGAHPDLVHLAAIPLTVLLFTRALTRYDVRAALGAALTLGVAALASLYIMDFASITVALLFIFLALEERRWREGRFWRVVVIFGLASALVVGLRIAPLIRNAAGLEHVIEQKYSAETLQRGPLTFIMPSHFNPIFAPLTGDLAARSEMWHKWPAYLGLVPLGLSLTALAWKEHRGRVWTWFGIMLFFILLSMGPVLKYRGEVYESVRLPASYLAHLLPIRAVARPGYFVIAALLALGVCAAHGLDWWLGALNGRTRARAGVVLGVSALLLFEYWNGFFPGVDAEQLVSPFYAQIAGEEGDFALIDLRMGRDPSKYYMYYQTIHERPIVEGLSSRMPANAYAYVDDNVVLNRWRYRTPLDCESLPLDDYMAGLDSLSDAGFRYVIVHHTDTIPLSAATEPYFANVPITYQDWQLTVFRLDDLRAHPPCSY